MGFKIHKKQGPDSYLHLMQAVEAKLKLEEELSLESMSTADDLSILIQQQDFTNRPLHLRMSLQQQDLMGCLCFKISNRSLQCGMLGYAKLL